MGKQAPTLGSYLDDQQCLIAAGWIVTYAGNGSGTVYRVTISKANETHSATGLLSWATQKLARKYAKARR